MLTVTPSQPTIQESRTVSMSTSTLVILLGIASSITLIISALSVHKKRLLMFGIATGSIVAIEYGIAGSWVGLASLSIGLVWTILMLFAIKKPFLGHWGFAALFIAIQAGAFTLLSDWGHMTALSFIPLIGGIGGIIAIFFKEMIYTKSLLIALGAMWLVYEFHFAMYSQMVGESLNFISNIVALTTLLVALRQGIPESMVKDVDTRVIETITTSIPTITASIHLPKKSKRSGPVKGAHPTSVEYARFVEDFHRQSN